MADKNTQPEQIVADAAADRSRIANGKTHPASLQRSRDHRTDLLPLAEGVRRTEAGAGQRMKELEKENGTLKRLVAELSLEKQVLKDVAEGNF